MSATAQPGERRGRHAVVYDEAVSFGYVQDARTVLLELVRGDEKRGGGTTVGSALVPVGALRFGRTHKRWCELVAPGKRKRVIGTLKVGLQLSVGIAARLEQFDVGEAQRRHAVVNMQRARGVLGHNAIDIDSDDSLDDLLRRSDVQTVLKYRDELTLDVDRAKEGQLSSTLVSLLSWKSIQVVLLVFGAPVLAPLIWLLMLLLTPPLWVYARCSSRRMARRRHSCALRFGLIRDPRTRLSYDDPTSSDDWGGSTDDEEPTDVSHADQSQILDGYLNAGAGSDVSGASDGGDGRGYSGLSEEEATVDSRVGAVALRRRVAAAWERQDFFSQREANLLSLLFQEHGGVGLLVLWFLLPIPTLALVNCIVFAESEGDVAVSVTEVFVPLAMYVVMVISFLTLSNHNFFAYILRRNPSDLLDDAYADNIAHLRALHASLPRVVMAMHGHAAPGASDSDEEQREQQEEEERGRRRRRRRRHARDTASQDDDDLETSALVTSSDDGDDDGDDYDDDDGDYDDYDDYDEGEVQGGRHFAERRHLVVAIRNEQQDATNEIVSYRVYKKIISTATFTRKAWFRVMVVVVAMFLGILQGLMGPLHRTLRDSSGDRETFFGQHDARNVWLVCSAMYAGFVATFVLSSLTLRYVGEYLEHISQMRMFHSITTGHSPFVVSRTIFNAQKQTTQHRHDQWQLVLDTERNLQLWLKVKEYLNMKKVELVSAAVAPLSGIMLFLFGMILVFTVFRVLIIKSTVDELTSYGMFNSVWLTIVVFVVLSGGISLNDIKAAMIDFLHMQQLVVQSKRTETKNPERAAELTKLIHSIAEQTTWLNNDPLESLAGTPMTALIRNKLLGVVGTAATFCLAKILDV